MPNDDAINQILAAKAEIDDMLARLQQHSDEHFGVNPDRANWSDAAEANRLKAALREICDMAFGEGEYAETASTL